MPPSSNEPTHATSRATDTVHTETPDRSPAAWNGVQRDHIEGHEPTPLIRRDRSRRSGRHVRDWLALMGWLQLLLGGLGGLAVLGIGAELTGIVAPLLLISVGIALLFGTFLLLAVVLLRVATTDETNTAPAWARCERPPINRRP